MTTSATAIATRRRVSGPAPWNWLVSSSHGTKREDIRKSAAWTIVSEASSTAPAASGLPATDAMRCRKRRFMPIRPAELGTVRLMNLSPIARPRTAEGERGRHGSRPRRPTRPTRSGARISATTTQASISLAQLMGDRAEADLGQLADQHVGSEDQGRHQEEVLRADPAHGRDLGPSYRSRRRRRLGDP